MKTRKLLLVALLLAFASVGFGQNTIDHLGKIRMRYNNNGIPDTLTMSFSGDTVKYNANEGFHKFNGGVIADSLKLTGENSWVTELFGDSGGANIQIYEARCSTEEIRNSQYPLYFDEFVSITGDTLISFVDSMNFKFKQDGIVFVTTQMAFIDSTYEHSYANNFGYNFKLGDIISYAPKLAEKNTQIITIENYSKVLKDRVLYIYMSANLYTSNAIILNEYYEYLPNSLHSDAFSSFMYVPPIVHYYLKKFFGNSAQYSILSTFYFIPKN